MNKLKSIAVIGPNADQVQFGDYTFGVLFFKGKAKPRRRTKDELEAAKQATAKKPRQSAKSIVKAGVKAVVKPGTKAVTKTGTKAVAKTGTKALAKTGTKAVAKTPNKTDKAD